MTLADLSETTDISVSTLETRIRYSASQLGVAAADRQGTRRPVGRPGEQQDQGPPRSRRTANGRMHDGHSADQSARQPPGLQDDHLAHRRRSRTDPTRATSGSTFCPGASDSNSATGISSWGQVRPPSSTPTFRTASALPTADLRRRSVSSGNRASVFTYAQRRPTDAAETLGLKTLELEKNLGARDGNHADCRQRQQHSRLLHAAYPLAQHHHGEQNRRSRIQRTDHADQ